MSMFDWLFARPPLVGSKWRFDHRDPFDEYVVTILEVKDGWVKYAFPYSGINTRPIREFRSIYRLIKE